MRRSKTGSAPQDRAAQARGNFTPPSRAGAPAGGGAPQAGPPPAADGTSGSRMKVRNWRVPTRLNAILLLPVLVALVFGGVKVQSDFATWQEAEEAQRTAELVESAAD